MSGFIGLIQSIPLKCFFFALTSVQISYIFQLVILLLYTGDPGLDGLPGAVGPIGGRGRPGIPGSNGAKGQKGEKGMSQVYKICN